MDADLADALEREARDVSQVDGDVSTQQEFRRPVRIRGPATQQTRLLIHPSFALFTRLVTRDSRETRARPEMPQRGFHFVGIDVHNVMHGHKGQCQRQIKEMHENGAQHFPPLGKLNYCDQNAAFLSRVQISFG